jgi:hypothetical protein
MADFDAVHERLRAILEPYLGRLVSNPLYGIDAIGWPGGTKHDYFAGTPRDRRRPSALV